MSETVHTLAAERGFNVDSGREEIIFGEPVAWDREENSDVSGGIIRLDDSIGAAREGLTLSELRTLRREDYVSGDQQHNYSPTIAEFIDHGERLADRYDLAPSDVRYIAYIVSPERRDARIDVCGMYVDARLSDADTTHIRSYFGRHFGPKDPDVYQRDHADERDLRGVASAWWD